MKTDDRRPRQRIVGDDVTRFRSKVDTASGPDACWPFLGGRDGHGYGIVRFQGKPAKAHRVAFFIEHGRWPEPMACHRCDNRPCCNPSHIYEGTATDNVRDMVVRDRIVTADGASNGRARLDEGRSRTIQRRYAAGESAADLAAEFGVSKSTIHLVLRGEHWTVRAGAS